MKKILLLFCAMLTCVGMSAKKVDAVWGIPADNGAWDSENNVYSWTLNYSNLTTVFETPDGALTKYTVLHLTTSELVGEPYRVCFMNGGSVVAQINFYSAGQKDLVLAERPETKDKDLSTVTHIAFGGLSASGSVKVTNMYLEGPDELIKKAEGEYDFINIDVLKQEDGSVTTLIPTVENDEYTYTATGSLQFGFKHKNIDVKGYDQLCIEYSTGSGSWCLQPKEGDLGGWTQLPSGDNKTYTVTIPEGTNTLSELSLFSLPWSTPSAPITVKSIKLHKAPKPSTVEEFTSVEELIANKFYMISKNVSMGQFTNSGVDMSTANVAIAVNDNNSYRYFKVNAVDGSPYYQIAAYKEDGSQKKGWGGDWDKVNLGTWGSIFMGQSAADKYGTDFQDGSLWEITYVEDKGFTFRSVAEKDGNRKYISSTGGQSNDPAYWNCFNINADRFQNIEMPADYKELPISELVATGSATVNGEVIDMTNGGGAKWQYDTPQNWSGYKYLVISPKRRFVTSAQKDGGADAERTAVQVSVNGKSLQWIGNWNPKRLFVLDLTSTKEGLDLTTVSNAIRSVEISYGSDERGEWSLSAAYLTNTKPTYSESLYNHDAGALGDAETNADHVRTLSSTGTLGVVCLPYASAICGADAFEFVGVDSKESPNAIWVRPVMGILEAGKPYVFKTNTNLNVTFYKAGASTVAEAGNENGLYGVFTQQTVTGDNMYAVAGGKFKQAGEYTATVKENRAYLNIDEAPELGAGSAEVKGCINLFDENEATAIKELLNSNNEAKTMFDLSGRRVQNTGRGIYIVNGKKYVK